MLLAVAMIVAGGGLLAVAGDRLVDLAAALAERFGVSTAVIGLTVVAAGTSAPELFVSVTAAMSGAPALAIGNVVGSNIANIGFILGSCAPFGSVPFGKKVLKFEYPFLVLVSWISLLLCRDGLFDRLEATFFVASMAAFVSYTVWLARNEVGAREARELGAVVPAEANRLSRHPLWILFSGLALALVGLAAGAEVMVRGAVEVARGLGVTERVIGLTVVAIGTSLPELVASVAAAMKRQHEMAVSNVIGSNIFNLLLILGVTGLVRPVPIEPRIASTDMWVMMAFTVALLPLVVQKARLSRGGGLLLLAMYAGYLGVVAVL